MDLGPTELGEILDDLSQCAIVTGCNRPVLGRRGRSIGLTGLPTDAALDLLRSDLGRDLTSAERADAERLCDVVEGQPLRLRQAAALVRERRHSFADLARAAEADGFALDRLSVNGLAAPQRRALALLAFAAGALLPADLVGNVTDAAGTWDILASLRDRGLAEQDEDRFGLPICHADDYREMLLRNLELGYAVRVLVNWVRQRGPGSDDARGAVGAALSIIGYAAERAEWSAVVGLVEAIEPVLALSGRWDAWGDALARGLAAARLVSNLSAQAQMYHQLGVHEFAISHLDRAREYWQEALRLRVHLNDVAGAAVTRSNIALLPPSSPVAGHSPRHRPPRRVLSRNATAWTGVAVAAAVAVVIPLAHALTSSKHAATPTGSPIAKVTPTESGSSGNKNTGGGNNTTGNNTTGGNTTGGNTTGGNNKTTVTGKTPSQPGATATVSPTSYNGSNCPTVFTFSGTIHVSSGPVTVTYKWIRSDGAIAPEQTISFTGSGAQDQSVSTDTWTLSANGTHWEAIQILSPGSAQSNEATFTLNCQVPG